MELSAGSDLLLRNITLATPAGIHSHECFNQASQVAPSSSMATCERLACECD